MNGSILPPSRKFKAEDMAEAMLRSNVRTGTTVTKTTRCCGVGLVSPLRSPFAQLTATTMLRRLDNRVGFRHVVRCEVATIDYGH